MMQKALKSLPTPHTVKNQLPLHSNEATFIAKSREKAKNIFSRKDRSTLFIVGPCSIHHPSSAIEYALRLKGLAKRVSRNAYVVMRAFLEKPRTVIGWKGFVYDPHLNGSNNMLEGIIKARELLLKLAKIEIPLMTEFLDPLLANYFSDLITWGVVGARTSASQIHRQMASGLPMPIGFKNGTDGNIKIAINGALSARFPHGYLGVDDNGNLSIIQTCGNPYTHIVLRGSLDGTNYSAESVRDVMRMQKRLNSRILIDCAHGNSQKNLESQEAVFLNVIDQISDGNDTIMGAMIESFIKEGKQPFTTNMEKGRSITDPCLDWETTEKLLLWAEHHLSSSLSLSRSN